tara:strand:+ start:305 stop:586 length:282 start_codon:yes stop_codon:yes gene_type:complete
MLLKAIAICSFIYLTYWMYKDLRSRQINAVMTIAWLSALILVPYISLPIYLIVRAFSPKKISNAQSISHLCSKCGYENKKTSSCKKCGNTITL